MSTQRAVLQPWLLIFIVAAVVDLWKLLLTAFVDDVAEFP